MTFCWSRANLKLPSFRAVVEIPYPRILDARLGYMFSFVQGSTCVMVYDRAGVVGEVGFFLMSSG